MVRYWICERLEAFFDDANLQYGAHKLDTLHNEKKKEKVVRRFGTVSHRC